METPWRSSPHRSPPSPRSAHLTRRSQDNSPSPDVGDGLPGLRVDQPGYGPTRVMSLAMSARALPLMPACAAPETYSPWLSLPTTGSVVQTCVVGVANSGAVNVIGSGPPVQSWAVT